MVHICETFHQSEKCTPWNPTASLFFWKMDGTGANLDVPGRKWWDQWWSDQWVVITHLVIWGIPSIYNPSILTIDPNFRPGTSKNGFFSASFRGATCELILSLTLPWGNRWCDEQRPMALGVSWFFGYHPGMVVPPPNQKTIKTKRFLGFFDTPRKIICWNKNITEVFLVQIFFAFENGWFLGEPAVPIFQGWYVFKIIYSCHCFGKNHS